FYDYYAFYTQFLIFSLIISHLSFTTLFPYTTLFRSTLGIILVLSIDTIKFFAEVSFFSFITDTQWTPLFADKHFGILPLLTGTIDRKSTRLNSSHVKISYAVFCLKKKHAPVIPLPRL